MPKHRRHAAESSQVSAPPTPSLVEVGGYGLLAALVAGGVLLAAGRPLWQAVAIVLGTLVLLAILAILTSTRARHGRRRRR